MTVRRGHARSLALRSRAGSRRRPATRPDTPGSLARHPRTRRRAVRTRPARRLPPRDAATHRRPAARRRSGTVGPAPPSDDAGRPEPVERVLAGFLDRSPASSSIAAATRDVRRGRGHAGRASCWAAASASGRRSRGGAGAAPAATRTAPRPTRCSRAVARPGADPGVRARARRPDGRLRHPARPPDRARRVRPRARRTPAGAAGRPGSARRRRSCSATSPRSWADDMLRSAGLSAEAMDRAGEPWRAMRTEVLGGQYLDVLHQATGDASARAALQVDRYKTAAYTVERPLHLGAAIAGAAPGARRRLPPLRRRHRRRLPAARRPARRVRRPGRSPASPPATTCARASARCWSRWRWSGPTGAATRRARGRRVRAVGDPISTRPGWTGCATLLAELGAVQAVEQRIAALTGSALAALGRARSSEPAATQLAELAVTATRAAAVRARSARVPGRTDHVVVVGAGLAGSVRRAAPARRGPPGDRRGAGRRTPAGGPGGWTSPTRAGTYRVDPGPTVLTMPDLLDEAFAAVGEKLEERLDLVRLDPGLPGPVRRRLDDRRAHRRRGDGATRSAARAARRPRPATGELRDWLTAAVPPEIDTFIGGEPGLPAGPARARSRPAGRARRVRPARARGSPDAARRAAAADLLLPGPLRRRGAATGRSAPTA